MRVNLNKSDYLNVPQLAKMLSISVSAVRTRVKTDPNFVSHIIGPNGCLIFDKKIVNEFIAQQAAAWGFNKSDYMTATQLARLLGISAVTVRTRARTDPGFVRHIIAPNGHIMFDKKLVNEFIAQQAADFGWPVEETADE